MNSLFNKDGAPGPVPSTLTSGRPMGLGASKLRTMTSLGTDLASDDMLYEESWEEEERKLLEVAINAPTKMLG